MAIVRQNNPLSPYGAYRSPDLCPPSGGYSITADTQISSINLGKTLQLFYSRPPFNELGTTTYISDNITRISMTQEQVGPYDERPWIVTVNAIEFAQATDSPISRLSKDTILSAADTPPGALRYSTLQAEIIWFDGSAKNHVALVDIAGGTSFQIVARNVQINVLAPGGAEIGDPFGPSTDIIENGDIPGTVVPQRAGLVFNAIVSARIAPLNNQTSIEIAKFTKWTQVADDNVNFVAIPPAAKQVRIYNSNLSTVDTTEMNFWITDNLTLGYSVGVIDFVNTNSTALFEIPCGATHIATFPAAAAGSNRCFSFVFLVDPA